MCTIYPDSEVRENDVRGVRQADAVTGLSCEKMHAEDRAMLKDSLVLKNEQA